MLSGVGNSSEPNCARLGAAWSSAFLRVHRLFGAIFGPLVTDGGFGLCSPCLGHGGVCAQSDYAGGKFKLELFLPSEYPMSRALFGVLLAPPRLLVASAYLSGPAPVTVAIKPGMPA